MAEDNAANRCVLKALLQPFDIEVRLADDGCEAVAAANASAFDVLLMDANMPRMDGVEALRRIRREAGPCVAAPIYMLTADVFDDDVRRYIEAGADGVLGKPIEISQVFDVLSAVARKAA
ncbi:MAG TPA: response regulator [Phenylobacterium sp.]